MDNDISKRTVLVLLILTLVVSVVGTWTILSMPKTVYKTLEVDGPQQGVTGVHLTPQQPAPEPVKLEATAGVNIAQ